MTITQQQYDDYVRAENNYYLNRFTTRGSGPYHSYYSVITSLQNLRSYTPSNQRENIESLIAFYSSRLNSNLSNPQDRIDLRTATRNLTYSTSFNNFKSFINSVAGQTITSRQETPDREDLLALIESIENTPPFVPPLGSPTNFYETYIEQQSALSLGTPTGTDTPPTTFPTSTSPTSTSAVPNCYENNSVVMTIENTFFYLKLLPAIQSNIPMQGSSETPNTAPGLHIKIIPNLARLRIPGFAPVYQHLGIDSALITLVGTFVPEDGENPESFTNVTGFAPPENINDQTAYNQIRNSELERSSYLAASKFYDFAVKTGGEVSVYINVPENVNLDNNPFVLNTKPGFKGIIKSMDLFHRNLYRTWYTIQFEVSDFGMYSSTPLDMNQDINEAIQERVQIDDDNREIATQLELQNRISGIENATLISYNDADNGGYFRSGDSYYFRFADPDSCSRTFLSINFGTTVRCNDEQWVQISGINNDQARRFAQNRTDIPPGAPIYFPSYEAVRDVRRSGYQQFNLNGQSIREVDDSDITGAEIGSLVVQGGFCIGSGLGTFASATGTGAAAASGVGAPAAGPLGTTTIGLGVATLASCSSFGVSFVSTINEAVFGEDDDENEGTFEGIVLPIAVDIGAGLVGRIAAPYIRPVLKRLPAPIGRYFTRTSAGADDLVPPPGAPIDPPTGTSSPDIPSPTNPIPDTPPSGASSPDIPSPTNPIPDTPPSGTSSPPDNFIPPTSSAVSNATSTVSAQDINVYVPNFSGRGSLRRFSPQQIPLDQYVTKNNIYSIKVNISNISDSFDLRTVDINDSGAFEGSQEVIDFINTNSNRLRGSITPGGRHIVLSVP